MSSKPVRIPDAGHPIGITRHPARMIVIVGGRQIADSHRTLALREAGYPPVLYFPRDDVDMSRLTRSTHTTYCPYKGNATYYSVAAAGSRAENAVWSYEHPHHAVAEIAAYLAFYPDRVDSMEEKTR